MTEFIDKHLFDMINSFILLSGIIIAIWTVLRQLKPIRIQLFYDKIMTLESNINDINKDMWGINDNNIVKTNDGKEITVDLQKLSYMVCFLDTYVTSRALRLKRQRAKIYSEYSLVYKLFLNKVYRDYWKYIVRDNFYYNAPQKDKWIKRIFNKYSNKYDSEFINAVERTINKIEE